MTTTIMNVVGPMEATQPYRMRRKERKKICEYLKGRRSRGISSELRGGLEGCFAGTRSALIDPLVISLIARSIAWIE